MGNFTRTTINRFECQIGSSIGAFGGGGCPPRPPQWAQKRGEALFIIFEAVALQFSPKLKMQTLLSQKCLTNPKFIILHHL